MEKIAPPPAVKASPLNERDDAEFLPASVDGWSAFDMIVIGDVPPEFLTTEAQQQIAAAVRDRGSTLIVIAGPLNFPQRYGNSPLEELLPGAHLQQLDRRALSDHSTGGFRPMIAPEGISSVLSQFQLDEQADAQALEPVARVLLAQRANAGQARLERSLADSAGAIGRH